MFRGFIVLGIALTAGYVKGYLKGQEHTAELKSFIQELRDSEATDEFIIKLGDALSRLPDTPDTPEDVDILNDEASNGDGEIPIKSTTQGE